MIACGLAIKRHSSRLLSSMQIITMNYKSSHFTTCSDSFAPLRSLLLSSHLAPLLICLVPQPKQNRLILIHYFNRAVYTSITLASRRDEINLCIRRPGGSSSRQRFYFYVIRPYDLLQDRVLHRLFERDKWIGHGDRHRSRDVLSALHWRRVQRWLCCRTWAHDNLHYRLQGVLLNRTGPFLNKDLHCHGKLQ